MFVRYWHHVAGATKTKLFFLFLLWIICCFCLGINKSGDDSNGTQIQPCGIVAFNFYTLQDYVTYHQDDVGSLRSLQGPFAIRKLSIVAAVSRAFNLKG